jgi:mRNA interferase RelE/StbE
MPVSRREWGIWKHVWGGKAYLADPARGTGVMSWRISITPTAMRMLTGITDRRIREKIVTIIDRPAEEPEKQGKVILGKLAGFRSIRAVSRRYRIIYTVKGEENVVMVVAVGIRREGARDDIYKLTKKLLRLGVTG